MSAQSNDSSSGLRDFERELQIRRERIRSLATTAGIPTLECSDFDRIGPVRVTHTVKYQTEILWGNLRLEEFLEHDDLKAAERIVSRVKPITEEWFDSFEFHLDFKCAYSCAAGWFSTHESRKYSGLRIDHVYAAYAVNKVRSGCTEAETQAASSKDYSLCDFLVDFARYLRDPQDDDDRYISTIEPRGAELKQAFFVPNLKDP